MSRLAKEALARGITVEELLREKREIYAWLDQTQKEREAGSPSSLHRRWLIRIAIGAIAGILAIASQN